MVRVILEDITRNFLGFECDHCHENFIFLQGAISHQEEIEDNGGVCPNTETEDN